MKEGTKTVRTAKVAMKKSYMYMVVLLLRVAVCEA
jgi:hypothetical protein